MSESLQAPDTSADLYATPDGRSSFRWPAWITEVYQEGVDRRLTTDNEGDWAEAAFAAWLAVQDLRDAGYVLRRAEGARSDDDV